MPTQDEFLADEQGKRFKRLLSDSRIEFRDVLDFFSDTDRQDRMEAAERRGQPALAGVVAELEALPSVDRFFRSHDAHTTTRVRQAVGVVVRMVMEARGWSRTGKKGYLGRRATVTAGNSAPGAYYNLSGPSRWFNRAEHYRLDPGSAARHGANQSTQTDTSKYTERLREGLSALERIGTDAERKETLDYLMKALAVSRHQDGRPF